MLLSLKRMVFPDTAAAARYKALVERSRNPMLYTQCGIPDTLDGRYESIILHMAMEFRTLENPELRQHIMECFVEDMDRSLREMGVSDTGVGKRVKKMAAGLFGRLQAYAQITSDDQLKDMLLRNVYSTCEVVPEETEVQKLMEYFKA